MGGGKGHHGPGPAYNSLDVRVLLQPGGMTLHPPKLPWCSRLPARVPQPSPLPDTPLPPGEHTWSGPPQNLSTSLIGYQGCPMTLAPPELPRRISPGEKRAVTAPVAASSSCYACSCTLAAGTMQHLRLLLFLLLLLPGTWADPEDPFVFQCATGCDLYPNGSYTKFYHLAYNAHNFLSFDVDNSHWERREESALVAQVERQFNNFTGFSVTLQHLLNATCVDHMKKFIEYGKASLERLEPPVATVFARMPKPDQLLLVCRVTGFYPRPISVAWLQDGQEVPPGPALNTSAILPNADLTYQLRSILAVAPHDGHSYACRVRHRSLGTRSLLIPWGSSKVALGGGITIAVLLTMAAALAGAIWCYRRRS
ncbi:antigen-presenting glycoprotein CD1d-like isoform X3 [Harpia harpyja]|uniref:antigen-presenting glycoprotein CD1d-like isoform X3 n=1 Tax=Harpia harpyja TaxID=202280 RepID=UPI0022B1A32F|nr:antigen-presenting glycoprotein CD1d-like isoform X3 [Harpia harpyja]